MPFGDNLYLITISKYKIDTHLFISSNTFNTRTIRVNHIDIFIIYITINIYISIAQMINNNAYVS